MTNNTDRFTAIALKAAKRALEAAGWIHVCSIMHSGGASGNYGLCYLKNEETFYLNKDTYKELPD